MGLRARLSSNTPHWISQSHADATHPMVGTAGHVALIVSDFAKKNTFSLRGVGIYRYRGNHRWQTCGDGSAFALSLI
jgi:hypothetical protein